MAWEVVVNAPYNATQVVSSAKQTITALKSAFDAPASEACLAQHAEALKRMDLR
jgi:hypothetical protein